MAVRQLNAQGTPLPERAALERQVLERMVTSRVLVQNARRTGIRVTDGQLNKAIDRMAEENNLSREQFREAMEAEGLDIPPIQGEHPHADYDRAAEGARGRQ